MKVVCTLCAKLLHLLWISPFFLLLYFLASSISSLPPLHISSSLSLTSYHVDGLLVEWLIFLNPLECEGNKRQNSAVLIPLCVLLAHQPSSPLDSPPPISLSMASKLT